MQLRSSRLVNISSLSESTGIPVRTLRTLTAGRKIPVLKLGRRTLFFDVERVYAALERFEVKAISVDEGRVAGKVSNLRNN